MHPVHAVDTLQTQGLLLRPFRPDDLAAFERFGRDEAYLRYLGRDFPDPPTFVANNIELDREREPSWVICLGDEVVGSVFLGVDGEHRKADLAYLIAPSHWGMGIASEASRAIVALAFEHFDVDRVFSWTDAEHLASRRVMEHLGMRHEATLRFHRLRRDGTRADEVVYGMLRQEWR